MIDISESRPVSQAAKSEEPPLLYSREAFGESAQDEAQSSEGKSFFRRFSWRKLSVTSCVMLACIVLMFLCVIISLVAPEHALVNEAFDAFKMIALVVLGFVLGSSVGNHHNNA